MAEATDLDPEPVQSGRAGPPTGPAVGGADVSIPLGLLLVQHVVEMRGGGRPRRELNALAKPLEQVRVAFRAQEHPEQLSPGARVIA